ncbi:MAG: cytochrome b/b6 domain-containing protein [Chloroflexi bacterium]|nr:cytochrome b/b6 domain-containing protein [Chloroflexota bacterium]
MNEHDITTPKENEPETFVRFNVSQRVEHVLLMLAFIGLCVTGIPQRFYGESWASWLIVAMGGIETARLMHRFFAALLVLESLYHVAYIALGLLRGTQEPHMIPRLQDFRDALNMLRYSLGVAPRQPKFDRYDYRQKFEYWGLVLGNLIMIATGIVLWFPVTMTQIVPGELVPAAKEAHGGEALLALLVIVIWHLYSVHLGPVHFPGDISIFTGRISKEKMIEEHALEYARVVGITGDKITTSLEITPSPSAGPEGGLISPEREH